MDTDRGLLVPVIKDVNTKSLTDISLELSEISAKARDRKITPEEMDGGNFTISNLGGIGGTGNEWFAYDCYRRFVQMYGDVVLDLKPSDKNQVDPFE